jgi:RNase P/RNase MRP subunit p29
VTTLIRITKGPYTGMTGRIVNLTADTIRVRLTAHARLVRIPREDCWYEDVDETPLTAAQARERMSA